MSSTESDSRGNPGGSAALWLVAVMLISVGVSWACVFAPPRARLFLLLPLGLGLAIGAAAALAAQLLNVKSSRRLRPLVVVLAVAAFLNATYQSYVRVREQAPVDREQRAQQILVGQMLEQMQGVEPDLKARFEAEQATRQPSFAAYLAQRIAPLGRWPAPWPGAFLVLELTLAGLGAFLAMRSLWRNESPVATTVEATLPVAREAASPATGPSELKS